MCTITLVSGFDLIQQISRLCEAAVHRFNDRVGRPMMGLVR